MNYLKKLAVKRANMYVTFISVVLDRTIFFFQ